jgi:hypothetical protein
MPGDLSTSSFSCKRDVVSYNAESRMYYFKRDACEGINYFTLTKVKINILFARKNQHLYIHTLGLCSCAMYLCMQEHTQWVSKNVKVTVKKVLLHRIQKIYESL